MVVNKRSDFGKNKKIKIDEGTEKHRQEEVVEEELFPVAVVAEESGYESAAALSASSGW